MLVLGPDEALQRRVRLRPTETVRQQCFVNRTCPRIAHLLQRNHLLRRPAVQIYGLDARNVHPQIAVNSGAPDAQEHAQIPGRPTGTLGVTVYTVLVIVIPQHFRQQHLAFFLDLLLTLGFVFTTHGCWSVAVDLLLEVQMIVNYKGRSLG